MRTTPAWLTVREAARGWGVSRSQAYRIIQKQEIETGRSVLQKGRIRTADFLAIPRGDVQAAPMIPEVRELQEKVEALHDEQGLLIRVVAMLCKRLGVDAQSVALRCATSEKG